MYFGMAMPERIASTMITAMSSISVKARATGLRRTFETIGLLLFLKGFMRATWHAGLPGVLAVDGAVGPELARGVVVAPAVAGRGHGRRGGPGARLDLRRVGAGHVRIRRDGFLHDARRAERLHLRQGRPRRRGVVHGAVGVEVRDRRADAA